MKIELNNFNGIWENTYISNLINNLFKGYQYTDDHGARRPVDYSIYKNVNFFTRSEKQYSYYVLNIRALKILKVNEHGHPVQYDHIYINKTYKYLSVLNYEKVKKDLLNWLTENGYSKDE